MAKIHAGYANYLHVATSRTIHAGPGKIHAIITSGPAVGDITFYDNTAAAGTVLLILEVGAYQTKFIDLNLLTPIVFTVGLTIVTSANARCFVITEA